MQYGTVESCHKLKNNVHVKPDKYITIVFGKASVLHCMTHTDTCTCNKQGPVPLTREVYIVN